MHCAFEESAQDGRAAADHAHVLPIGRHRAEPPVARARTHGADAGSSIPGRTTAKVAVTGLEEEIAATGSETRDAAPWAGSVLREVEADEYEEHEDEDAGRDENNGISEIWRRSLSSIMKL